MNIKETVFELATKKFGPGGIVTTQEMKSVCEENKIEFKESFWLFVPKYRFARGTYVLPKVFGGKAECPTHVQLSPKKKTAPTTTGAPERPAPDMAPEMTAEVVTLHPVSKFNPNAHSEYDHAVVPEKDPFYIPFGDFRDIEKVLKTGEFFPIFISGQSGNGKTVMVEQGCARAGKPLVRVQMARETDEDDLIGGFRLIDGETKFLKGPVLRAMELGAVLLIDEADRADPGKVMCLQGILEGKPYYVKKTGEVVTPRHGFNVIVTANTKGKGSDDGRYVAASILDDAWLERFPVTYEQSFPPQKLETKILMGYLCHDRECGKEDQDFVDHLIAWADGTRRTFAEGAAEECIATRRLVHIIRTYRMFGDRMKSIELCINRFDTETKNSFLELYAKHDPNVTTETPEEATSFDDATSQSDPIPF